MNIIINIHINKEEIMKKIEKYRCEICKIEYSDKTDCLQCEKSHKTPVEITNTRYLPYSQNQNGYPVSVTSELLGNKLPSFLFQPQRLLSYLYK